MDAIYRISKTKNACLSKIRYLFLFSLILLCCGWGSQRELISIYPMQNYDQNVSHWIKSSDPNYDQPLMSSQEQQRRLNILFNHYFGDFSPWNEAYVNKMIQNKKSDNLKETERSIIDTYDNNGKSFKKIGYGENFQPYTSEWIHKIVENLNISQFNHFHYAPHNRAIAIDNLNARALPTDDVFFNSYKLPGQGYPFDHLQMSAIWAGTPLYILGTTKDRAWTLVISPDFVTWVKSSGIARTSPAFIKTWKGAALKKSIAITHTQTSMMDSNNIFRFYAYVGSFFPGTTQSEKFKVMIPIANTNREAIIRYALVSKQNATEMPLSATPKHFSHIMSTLIGRPYGWGNLYFLNDCSSELKSLYTPFGIWLPRHSSDQLNEGKITDLSSLSPKKRIAYVMQNAQPLTTIIYVPGHIVMYFGSYPNPKSSKHEILPMTFQDKWGFYTIEGDSRSVLGKSVLFPLTEYYPEDTKLITQAQESTFIMSALGKK